MKYYKKPPYYYKLIDNNRLLSVDELCIKLYDRGNIIGKYTVLTDVEESSREEFEEAYEKIMNQFNQLKAMEEHK